MIPTLCSTGLSRRKLFASVKPRIADAKSKQCLRRPLRQCSWQDHPLRGACRRLRKGGFPRQTPVVMTPSVADGHRRLHRPPYVCVAVHLGRRTHLPLASRSRSGENLDVERPHQGGRPTRRYVPLPLATGNRAIQPNTRRKTTTRSPRWSCSSPWRGSSPAAVKTSAGCSTWPSWPSGTSSWEWPRGKGAFFRLLPAQLTVVLCCVAFCFACFVLFSFLAKKNALQCIDGDKENTTRHSEKLVSSSLFCCSLSQFSCRDTSQGPFPILRTVLQLFQGSPGRQDDRPVQAAQLRRTGLIG